MSANPIAAPAAARSRETRQFAGAFVVMLALIAVAPFVAYPFFVMQALCFALFACAFNLLIGYVGLLSFGHAMFLGAASYVCAHAAKVWGLDPVLAILAGVACSAVLGFVAGALSIRSQGIYFAMITVALSQMIYFFCVEAPFTHGEDGIQGVPQGRALGADRPQPAGAALCLRRGGLPVRLSGGLSHGQFAVRRNPQGDP